MLIYFNVVQFTTTVTIFDQNLQAFLADWYFVPWIWDAMQKCFTVYASSTYIVSQQAHMLIASIKARV